MTNKWLVVCSYPVITDALKIVLFFFAQSFYIKKFNDNILLKIIEIHFSSHGM